jgi:N-acetylneuraminic acid mutarotase
LALARASGVYFPANGRFYAMGGRMSDNKGDDMTTPYEYNPKTNTWAFKAAPFPDNQVSNMACGVLTAGEKPYIYCVGGIAAGTTMATTRSFRYDPISDTMETAGIDRWSESATDTLPGGAAVVGNKLYILGGFTLGNNVTDRIFEFAPDNPVGSQWSKKTAALPVPLGFVPTAAIGNLIYTAGGYTFTPCQFTEKTNSYVFDPAKDSVSAIPNIPRPTGQTEAVALDGEMWIMGGGRTAPTPTAEVSIYSPLTGQWRSGFPLSTGEYDFAAATDGDRIFIAGGYKAAGTAIKSARVLDTASKSKLTSE